MSLVKGKVQATMKLPMLQNLIKRDPHSYKQEFLLQMNRYQSELEIFKLRPTLDSDRFTELAMFISHTCSCYKDYSQTFPQSIMVLIETNASVLHPEVRIKLMNALILMRNKNLIEPLMLINLSFRLFAIPDKSLRSTLKEYILNDIKTINSKRNDEKVNKSIQAFLYTVVSEDASIRAKKGIEILAELYRRRIWNDARTVNVVGEACLNPSPKIFVPAIRFFLGIENSMEEDEEEQSAVTREVNTHEHSKKTKKRLRVEQKQKSINEKKMKQHMQKLEEAVPLFPAIQVIHDPHSMAEKLFKKARQSGERFEVKLLLMNFISRLIGCHKLLVLGFYSFLQRYLTAHQKDVTQILAYLIQACHELIPPEDVLPIVKAIAYNFISERCTNEVIAVGINSVREIIRRVPAILKEDGMDDFIQDLAMYGKKTHKSVMIAAHGLINLIRLKHYILTIKCICDNN